MSRAQLPLVSMASTGFIFAFVLSFILAFFFKKKNINSNVKKKNALTLPVIDPDLGTSTFNKGGALGAVDVKNARMDPMHPIPNHHVSSDK